MNCANQIIHTIQPGDTLYSLAIKYRTTVKELLCLNPGIDIYNLQIGTGLVVCPGEPVVTPVPPIGTVPPTPVPPIGTVPPIMPVPPIYPLPPVTPVPPIGTVPPAPPVMPFPPIAPVPPVDAFIELLIQILEWIRGSFGDAQARKVADKMNDYMRDPMRWKK